MAILSTQNPNQAFPKAMLGAPAFGVTLQKISATINPATISVAPFVAGQAVKLFSKPGARGILVDAASAAADLVYGTILFAQNKNTFAPGDIVEVALSDSFVFLEASAAISAGAYVKTTVAGPTVVTAAIADQATGIAQIAATAAGQLIPVRITVGKVPA